MPSLMMIAPGCPASAASSWPTEVQWATVTVRRRVRVTVAAAPSSGGPRPGGPADSDSGLAAGEAAAITASWSCH
jgi:hypothetical protein